MFKKIKSDYMIHGEAVDAETVIRQRPEMESYVRENIMTFDRTELFWNLKDVYNPDSPFVFQIHFFKDKK